MAPMRPVWMLHDSVMADRIGPDQYEVCELIGIGRMRSEEHTSELQSRLHLVCRLLLEKKKRYVLGDTDESVRRFLERLYTRRSQARRRSAFRLLNRSPVHRRGEQDSNGEKHERGPPRTRAKFGKVHLHRSFLLGKLDFFLMYTTVFF